MTTTAATQTEILFKTAKNGKRRAYYWSTRQMRTFPMALAEAEMLIATGQAVELDCNPFASR